MRLRGPVISIGRTLIVSDLHLGLEDQHAGASGLVTRSEQVLDQVRSWAAQADRIVLNGDVLDDFALARLESRIRIGRALRALARGFELVLVRGNHDPMLASLRAGPIVDSVRIGSALVTHGDRDLLEVASREDIETCDTIVIGHEHPAITLSDGIRTERFKCFVRIPSLETPFGEKRVVIMPSAHPDLVGSDIGAFRSPIITADHPHAEVIVASDPPRVFGTLDSFTSQ